MVSYFVSPTLPIVRRMFGKWQISEFPENHKWDVLHPSLMLSCSRYEYNRDISYMAVDILRRWVYAMYSRTEVVLPPGFILHDTISYSDEQPPLIAVISDEFGNVFIVCRGTLTLKDLLMSTMDIFAIGQPPGPQHIHAGYKHIGEKCLRPLLNILSKIKPNDIVVTGHSLGAAVGILLAQCLFIRGMGPIVYAYGIPRFSNGDEYPFPINTVICSDDSISLGQLFKRYRHIGTVTFTEGVNGSPHTIDSYHSSIFFDTQRIEYDYVEDIDDFTSVD